MDELTSGLTNTTSSALSVRPPAPTRTSSSRSLPRSTLPRVTILFNKQHVPQHLRQGVVEIAKHAPRNNVVVVDSDQDVPAHGVVWIVRFVGVFAPRKIFRQDQNLAPTGLSINCNHDDFTLVPADDQFRIEISYARPIEAFRGLGHVLAISRGLASFQHPDVSEGDDMSTSQQSEDDETKTSNGNATKMNTSRLGTPADGVKWKGNVGQDLRRREDCQFESVGVMIDCSRNGVMLPSAVKFLLRQIALMGCNVLQLYCEDTYQIPGEPFFGYFRGPYTEDELRDIDEYAHSLGIEVIACIQTLGHLGQMLQWPKYGQLRDTAEVLLADYAETYAFIEKMIKAICSPLRSKRIHIGMDEAHGVSEGRYRQLFGYKESTKVFTEHLKRVNEICIRNGLSPMIWSDMLFCLPAKNNQLSGYYDPNSVISADLSSSIPDEINTVFWDYYHTDSRPYSAKVAQHWQLAGKAPWMASGVWTWSRFWTALPFTFATVRACMKASKDQSSGVKSVMTTIWGDEGNEFDLYSSLPGMLYQAEQAYTPNEEVDAQLLRKKFDGITGGDFDDYVYASKLDDTQPESQPIDIRTHYTPNISKFLLWEEPFFSFLSPQYRGYDLEYHYQHVATYLEQALSSEFSTMSTFAVPHSIEDYPANKRLQLPYLLAKILSLKCHLRDRLAFAYKGDDRVELEALAGNSETSRLSRLRSLVKELHSLHRNNWMTMYKPFGWEVLDLRYGGLIARLETMHQRIVSYLDPEGTVDRLEELEVDQQVVFEGQRLNLMLDYARASRPQYI
ncbi:hypothetical protein OIO90_004502 [Microbotryomycetes sp. JL221]|nr:hypothetical protein OIO90_004502 [Microbotryomycetes sp. JL221]